ncbi:MAG: subtilisin family serine protease [Candidatus Latescibacterota bacterium]|jgi:subtilisin family serine protease
MKPYRLFFVISLVFTLSWLGCSADRAPVSSGSEEIVPPAAKSAASIPGRYIVVLDNDVTDVPGIAAGLARAHGAVPERIYRHAIKGFAVILPDGAAAALARRPGVKYVELDQIVTIVGVRPDKGKPGGQPGGGGGTTDPPDPQVTPWGITRVGGGNYSVSGTAWVIDTGIDLDHPDLNVDVGRSISFVTRGKNSPDDGHGHGTHVAGTIAAIDNQIDVIGVAAGASVVAVRVLDKSGSGFNSWVLAGIDYVANNALPGDVANMSLGGSASQALDDAVVAAAAGGINFALAAGNESDDANNHSPARANGPHIYTVSAIGEGDVFASFSNYGNPPIDYAAPGVSVLSTKKGGGTTTFSGTSMAAPHVAGLLLLGLPVNGGFAIGDPDGTPDPIAHR